MTLSHTLSPPPPLYTHAHTHARTQLNAQVSVRGTNLTNFVLRVSCRGHMYKFSVGPSIENLEESRLVCQITLCYMYP